MPFLAYHNFSGNIVGSGNQEAITFYAFYPKIAPFIGQTAVPILEVDDPNFIQKIPVQTIYDVTGYRLSISLDRTKGKQK